MSTATDVLRTKSDAELQFFVENPGYYHVDLVNAARQELRRRGISLASQITATDQADAYAKEAGSSRRPVVVGALGLAIVAGALFWANRPATPPVAAPTPKPAPTLETVASHALPTFDIDKIVDAQLARIPATEKQTPQTLRQFKDLIRRFWTAETQTEFLTTQAYAGQASPVFAEQAILARETWREWNKAAMYSYHLGPTMQAQYERMGEVASNQQHILKNLPDMLADKSFLTDREMVARDSEVQDLLASLRPTSPVTGKRYRVTVLKFKP